MTRFTTNLLERTACPRGQSLKSKLESLPCRRDILEWSAYLSRVTLLLPTIFGAYEALGVRRWKFRAHIFRDRSLDKICQRCCLGKSRRRSSNSLPTLVAFGAANSCSTGFGYAPAPQARLRRIMEKIHGAYVCLIDKFHTSQCCSNSSCHSLLKAAVASEYDRRGIYQHRQQLHGVCFCENCLTDKVCKNFWNRDLNAANNICHATCQSRCVINGQMLLIELLRFPIVLRRFPSRNSKRSQSGL